MKIRISNVLIFCFLLVLNQSSAQDSLTVKVLDPLSYSFTIVDGQLKGAGADFLRKEISTAQFTLLGDYSDSKRISDFTRALIPELDQFDYKMMVLDIGPIAGQTLHGMAKRPEEVVNSLKALNQKYIVKDKGEIKAPIPFFEHVEDALIVEQAGQYGWGIAGITRESWDGLAMLTDKMYSNFSNSNQALHKELYQEALVAFDKYYKERDGDLLKFSESIRTDNTIQRFLEFAATEVENLSIIEAFHYSLLMCEMYAKRQFYDKNVIQVKNEKRILNRELMRHGFDINKDKLLVKMDMESLSKGFNPAACYGIGNTLNELASFNGKETFNIGFLRRYHKKDGELVDQLLDANDYTTKQLRELMQMGQVDKWVVIDLRPLIGGYYYWPQKYLLRSGVEDLMKRYDVLIIPEMELSPSANY